MNSFLFCCFENIHKYPFKLGAAFVKTVFQGVRIGPVVKKDVMRASTMLEHEQKYAVILAFDVKVERDAQEMADREVVKIFQADIIYHLFDRT